MSNALGVIFYLGSYLIVPTAAVLLYPTGMLEGWFIIASFFGSVLFSQLISRFWPGNFFHESQGAVLRQIPVFLLAGALTHWAIRGAALYLAWWISGALIFSVAEDVNSLPPLVHILVAVLIYEGVGFVQHWLFHAVPWLWTHVHSVHHELREFGPSLALRVHFFEYFVAQLTRVLALNVLGFDSRVIVAVIAWEAWAGGMIHSNCRIRFGWINFFLATPETHLWHHAIGTRANYSFGVLSIFDVLAQTLVLSPGRVPEVIGVPKMQRPRNLLEILSFCGVRTSQTPSGVEADRVKRS